MIAINISSNYRVAVDYDVDAPLDTPACCYDTLLYEVVSCNNLDIHEGSPSVIDALEHVENAVTGYDYDSPDSVAVALIKHLERNGYKAVYHTFFGTCPSDWCDAVVAVAVTEGVDLDCAISDWERWYNNEYYTLTLERRHIWTDDNSDEMSTWDKIETVYKVEIENPDDDAEIIKCAREFFEINEEA